MSSWLWDRASTTQPTIKTTEEDKEEDDDDDDDDYFMAIFSRLSSHSDALSFFLKEEDHNSSQAVFQGSNRVTTTRIVKEKGLENKLGQQNCFLNVIIQSLWHLKPFNLAFREFKCLSHPADTPCVVCALQVLFTNYEWSEAAVLPPTVLRETLSKLYRVQGRFQVGEMDDASEVLDAILRCVHRSGVPPHAKADTRCQPPCPAHQVFYMEVLQQGKCTKVGCGATCDPLSVSSFIHYIYVRQLIEEGMDSALAARETRSCPRKGCGSQARGLRYLLEEDGEEGGEQRGQRKAGAPLVLALSLVWTSTTAGLPLITQALDAITLNLHLQTLFDNELPPSSIYRLTGMVGFYGCHYLSFFFDSKRKQWLQFDDAKVTTIGPSWDDVCDKARKAHLQPSLLFYELIENNNDIHNNNNNNINNNIHNNSNNINNNIHNNNNNHNLYNHKYYMCRNT
jgi:hypothetical protein